MWKNDNNVAFISVWIQRNNIIISLKCIHAMCRWSKENWRRKTTEKWHIFHMRVLEKLILRNSHFPFFLFWIMLNEKAHSNIVKKWGRINSLEFSRLSWWIHLFFVYSLVSFIEFRKCQKWGLKLNKRETEQS